MFVEYCRTSFICIAHVPQSQSKMFLTASQDSLVKAWITEDDVSIPTQLGSLVGQTNSVWDAAVSPSGKTNVAVWDGTQKSKFT